MTVNEFLAKYRKPIRDGSEFVYARPRVKCKDGFSVSIQAGYGLYSQPRTESDFYTKVELGYPSHIDYSLLKYAKNPKDPTDTIYAFVPTALVDSVLEMHGGIVGADMSNDGAGVWEDGGEHD